MITEKHRWILAHSSYKGDDCLIWPFSCMSSGYGQLMVERKMWGAHRLMCTLAHGEPPSNLHHAAHSCGNRQCVNRRHISWKTASQNQLDRKLHGRSPKGSRTSLTNDQIQMIRDSQGKETPKETAMRFGITESYVRMIYSGKVLTARKWELEDDAFIISGWRSGKTIGQIASKLRRTYHSVEGRLRRLREKSATKAA